jgi:hypothetical protein
MLGSTLLSKIMSVGTVVDPKVSGGRPASYMNIYGLERYFSPVTNFINQLQQNWYHSAQKCAKVFIIKKNGVVV